jgi:hypothetical protein
MYLGRGLERSFTLPHKSQGFGASEASRTDGCRGRKERTSTQEKRLKAISNIYSQPRVKSSCHRDEVTRFVWDERREGQGAIDEIQIFQPLSNRSTGLDIVILWRIL